MSQTVKESADAYRERSPSAAGCVDQLIKSGECVGLGDQVFVLKGNTMDRLKLNGRYRWHRVA